MMRMKLKSLFDIFKEFNKTMSIFTTHFLKDIEIFCDKLALIENGKFLCIDQIYQLK